MQFSILSFAYKSSSYIFSTIIMVCIITAMILQKIQFKRHIIKPILLLTGASGAMFGRTLYLTGCLSNFLFPSIWKILGIPIKPPYGWSTVGRVSIGELLNIEYLKTAIQRLAATMYAPITNATSHVIITWSGLLFTVVLCTVTAMLIYKAVHRNSAEILSKGFIVGIWVLISGASVGSFLLLTIPDGNYFGIWYVMTFIMAACFIGLQTLKSIFAVLLACYSGFMTLASSGGWSLGLTPIRIDNRGYYNSKNWIMQYMQNNHWSSIYNRLEQGDKQRVVLFSEKMQFDFFLPTIMDSWNDICIWGRQWTVNTKQFTEYMKNANVQYIAVDQDYLFADSNAKNILTELASQGYIEADTIEENHGLFRVHTNPENVDPIAINFVRCNKASIASGVYDDNWATQTAELNVANTEAVQIRVSGQYVDAGVINPRIEVYVDGNKQDEYKISDSKIDITVQIPGEGSHNVVLKSNFTIEATPPDIREDLSYLLSSVEIVQLSTDDKGDKNDQF